MVGTTDRIAQTLESSLIDPAAPALCAFQEMAGLLGEELG
jgi:hypothetical protein